MSTSGAQPERVSEPDETFAGRLLQWPSAFAHWLWDWRRIPRRLEPRSGSEPVPRFRNICISREAGAGGGTIARLVGQELGWKVYDHEIVESIARGMGITNEEVKILDELAPSLAQDWILPLREEYYAPQEAYLDHLAKLIATIGQAGDSVIVGRGAGFMLPRDETLSVRIVAPLKARAEHLAEVMHISARTGRRAASELDRRRAKFVRVLHRIDASDPHNYDITLDSHSLGLKMAADLIVRAIELGEPTRPALAPRAWNPDDHDEPANPASA
jgi:cytidylate kinase